MYKIIVFVFLFCFLFTEKYYTQNIGINANATPPDNSAMLDVDVSALPANNKKGLLIPRVALSSNTDVTTIPSPAVSLLVWNTGTSGLTPAGFYYWDGSQWQMLTNSSTSGSNSDKHCYTCDGF